MLLWIQGGREGVGREFRVDRRAFLKGAAGAAGLADLKAWGETAGGPEPAKADREKVSQASSEFAYPRKFRGEQLQLIAFPIGGVAAGSIGLGGRGQLCDWEMRNHPQKGYRP